MSEPVTIYSTDYMPDVTRALDVLAFLLVPERAFYDATDTPDTRAAVRDVLRVAKQEALAKWYAARVGAKL